MCQIYKHDQLFILENNSVIPSLQIAYHTFGCLNETRTNVIWVCHALTANSDVFSWWSGLFGPSCLFNPGEHFVVCANILGSCYGTTGPTEYVDFPQITIKDMVKAHIILAKHLNIEQIHTLIGGSLGGQQAMEWGIEEPSRFLNLILIATNARHSAWGIAFNESQRMALRADPTFQIGNGGNNGGQAGLKAARAIALLSYRSYEAYASTQTETDNEKTKDFKAASYQRHQGEKLVKRFNAHAYYTLTQAMDSHNVGRGRTSIQIALRSIQAKTLVITMESDVLFPAQEQEYLAKEVPGARYHVITTKYGHDGFLIETEKIVAAISGFYSDYYNLQPMN